MTDQQKRILDRLRGLCSRREYCVTDVLKKATDGLEGDRAAAQEVVDVLVKEKYVDDLRYASAFARDKSAIQGWGEVKIRYMLSAKGVPRDVIDKALEEIDQDKADSRLEKLLQNKEEWQITVISVITLAPVVLKPDIISKQAFM